MATRDDTALTIALVGIGGYLLYLKLKQLCPALVGGSGTVMDCLCPGQSTLWGCLTNLHFGEGGAPGLLPGGAGGTPGAPQTGIPGGPTQAGTPGTGGPGAVVNTASTPPSPPSEAGGPGGTFICVDDNLNFVGFPDADNNCPPGTKVTMEVSLP